jgi:catechol 2,3-dioxygenase-like lactoylglutathione lyase family enzyme
MATNYPINPRVRAFGKARIDIAGRAKNQAQWEKLWKQPANSFPFVWGESWKQCVEYRVDDFPAEVGFYVDILGLPINALDPAYAMFTSPQGDFFFSVVPTPHTEPSTPPDAIRLQFMVQDIFSTTHELQQRGIDFEQTPQPIHPASSLSIATFRTPHGICVELWGKVEAGISTQVKMNLLKDQEKGDDMDDEDDDGFENDESEKSEDEDEFDGNEERGELITKQNSNENEDEGELESEEEIDEDADDDGLGEDLEDDEAEDEFDEDDEFDDDEDEEDYDGDEDVSALKSDPLKSVTPNSPTLPTNAETKSPDKQAGNQKSPAPEYIDLDIP